MDEIRKGIERVEERMARSQAAFDADLAAQGAAIGHLQGGQNDLVEGHRSLAEGHRSLSEGQRSLSDAMRRLAEAVGRTDEAVERMHEAVERVHETVGRVHETVGRLDETVGRLDESVGRLDETVTGHGRAMNELQRSNRNLRSSFSEYRRDTDQMFGHLKAAVFVLEVSGNARFQSIEARLDELEKRPPAA